MRTRFSFIDLGAIELLLALALFSGPIKILLPQLTMIVNFAMLAFIIMLACRILIRGVVLLAPLVVFLCSVAFISAYFLPNVNNDYAASKYLGLLVNVLWIYLLIESRAVSQRKFIKWLVVLASIVAIIFTYKFSRYQVGIIQDQTIGKSYLNVGYHLSFAILAVVFGSEIDAKKRFILCLLLTGVVFYSGARGPLLIMLGCFLVGFSLRFDARVALRVSVAMAVLGICVFQLVGPGLLEQFYDRTLARISYLFSAGADSSISERMDLIEDGLSAANSTFFGFGVGGFADDVLRTEEKVYPHNILLELYLEFGFASVCAFIAFAGSLLIAYGMRRDALVVVMLLYSLLNAMKSFSLEDQRILLLALFWAQVFYVKKLNRVVHQCSFPGRINPRFPRLL